MLLFILLDLASAPYTNIIKVLLLQHHLQSFLRHVLPFLLILHEILAFVPVKDVLLHDQITKEALDVLLRTGLRMHSQLSLRELLEAKPAFEVLLLHCHILPNLAVEQMFLHQLQRVGLKAVTAGKLLMGASLLVVHQLVRT